MSALLGHRSQIHENNHKSQKIKYQNTCREIFAKASLFGFLFLTIGIFLSTLMPPPTTFLPAAPIRANGTSKSTPWRHAPGMPDCSGTVRGFKASTGATALYSKEGIPGHPPLSRLTSLGPGLREIRFITALIKPGSRGSAWSQPVFDCAA